MGDAGMALSVHHCARLPALKGWGNHHPLLPNPRRAPAPPKPVQPNRHRCSSSPQSSMLPRAARSSTSPSACGSVQVRYQDGISGDLTTAHPQLMPNGDLINILSAVRARRAAVQARHAALQPLSGLCPAQRAAQSPAVSRSTMGQAECWPGGPRARLPPCWLARHALGPAGAPSSLPPALLPPGGRGPQGVPPPSWRL